VNSSQGLTTTVGTPQLSSARISVPMATVFPALPRIQAAVGGALAAAGRHAEAVQAYETALARLADATWLPPGEREGVGRRVEQDLSKERANVQQ
jgi:hypothetical protein